MKKSLCINNINVPNIAFGTGRINDNQQAYEITLEAVKNGYRHFDLAVDYENLDGIANAIKYCIDNKLVNRKDLFINLKISEPGYNNTFEIVNKTLLNFNFEYFDMLLLHYPWDNQDNWEYLIIDSYRALEKLYKENKVKIIGVSNFRISHLTFILNYAIIKPMVNQLEINPSCQQKELVNFCLEKNIRVTAYSPLMEILEKPLLHEIGKKYQKTAAQIALRWSIQKGFIPIVSSKFSNQIKENLDIFDFELTSQDIDYIDSLDKCLYKYQDARNTITLHNSKDNFPTNSYTRKFKLFGLIPIFKEVKKSRRITKLYFFGIPFLKIDTKTDDMEG